MVGVMIMTDGEFVDDSCWGHRCVCHRRPRPRRCRSRRRSFNLLMILVVMTTLTISNVRMWKRLPFLHPSTTTWAWITTMSTTPTRRGRQDSTMSSSSCPSSRLFLATTTAESSSTTTPPPPPSSSSSSSSTISDTSTPTTRSLRPLYPAWDESRTTNGTIEQDGHRVFYKIYFGNHYGEKSKCQPLSTLTSALFLHGGPGAGCNSRHVQFFDPHRYDVVVLWDQRGCGRSTTTPSTATADAAPAAAILHNNTLLDLIHDCERLRHKILGSKDNESNEAIPPWTVVLGGSWGSTLALGYAQEYPHSMQSVILRGVCAMRQSEIDWLFADSGPSTGSVSAAQTLGYKKAWKRFEEGSGANNDNYNDRVDDPRKALRAYHQLFTTRTEITPTRHNLTQQRQQTAARSWFQWEMLMSISHKLSNLPPTANFSDMTTVQTAMQTWDEQRQCELNKTDPRVGVAVATVGGGLTSQIEWSLLDAPTGRLMRSVSSSTPTSSTTTTMATTTTTTSTIPAATVTSIPTQVERLRQGIIPANHDPSPPYDDSTFYNKNKNHYLGVSPQVLLTCHYSYHRDHCMNGLDLLADDRMKRLTTKKDSYSSNLSIIAVQGGMDRICPPDTALDLVEAWSKAAVNAAGADATAAGAAVTAAVTTATATTFTSAIESATASRSTLPPQLELRMPLKAGHSMYDPFITHELVQATDHLADRYST